MTIDTVRWTQAHLDALEGSFPERVDESDTSKLLISAGSRAVVLWVKARIKHQEKRLASS
jgi:hypothetical protein